LQTPQHSTQSFCPHKGGKREKKEEEKDATESLAPPEKIAKKSVKGRVLHSCRGGPQEKKEDATRERVPGPWSDVLNRGKGKKKKKEEREKAGHAFFSHLYHRGREGEIKALSVADAPPYFHGRGGKEGRGKNRRSGVSGEPVTISWNSRFFCHFTFDPGGGGKRKKKKTRTSRTMPSISCLIATFSGGGKGGGGGGKGGPRLHSVFYHFLGEGEREGKGKSKIPALTQVTPSLTPLLLFIEGEKERKGEKNGPGSAAPRRRGSPRP